MEHSQNSVEEHEALSLCSCTPRSQRLICYMPMLVRVQLSSQSRSSDCWAQNRWALYQSHQSHPGPCSELWWYAGHEWESLQVGMFLCRHLSIQFSTAATFPEHHCHLVTVGEWGFDQAEKLFLVSWSWMKLFSASEQEEEMDVLPAARTISFLVLYTLIASYWKNWACFFLAVPDNQQIFNLLEENSRNILYSASLVMLQKILLDKDGK